MVGEIDFRDLSEDILARSDRRPHPQQLRQPWEQPREVGRASFAGFSRGAAGSSRRSSEARFRFRGRAAAEPRDAPEQPAWPHPQ